MYPVADTTGMTMKSKKLAANELRIKTKTHTDLIQKKNMDDVPRWRKSRKKARGSGTEEGNSTGIQEEKVEDMKEEIQTECHDYQTCGKVLKRKNSLKIGLIDDKLKAEKDSCNEGFKKETDRQEHEMNCERNEKQLKLVCCFCDLPCDTPKELRTHENKHRPTRKTKNYKKVCICIECKKAFDSGFSLKVHMQNNHKSVEKPETNEETTDIKVENMDMRLTDVSNLPNQPQYGREPQTKPPSIQIPQLVTTISVDKDKPFICLHCGSRYKYEKSKLKHELKYHGTPETRLQTGDDSSSQQTETSQVTKQGESVPVVPNADRFEMQTERDNAVNNNNIIPVNKIKEENDISLPVIDVSVQGSPDKQLSGRPHPFRNPIIKKKCIGCDKAFDGPKERDEHELQCGLNCFNRKFNCMFCDHPFSKPKTLRKHENKHRPARKTKKYKNRCVCIECNKTFDAIYSLRVHMKKLHRKSHVTPVENKPFGCSICDSRFKYENSKYKHEMRYHGAAVGYSIGDVFTNFNALPTPGDAPVVCKLESSDADDVIKEEPSDGCGESLGSLTENKVINPVYDIKTEMDTPLMSPEGDVTVKEEDVKAPVPFQRRKRKARQPVEKKPKKQKTGPFVCNKCEAKFNSPQGLWLHSYHQNMRTKRLSCIGCGKSFKSEKDTEEHELRCVLNHNEYDFNCMFCDEPFGNPKLLRNHELKHRPRRKTKNHKCVCIDCRKPFDSIHSLKEHIRECHRNGIKVENGEAVRTRPNRGRTLTLEEMKSCFVLLTDIGQGETMLKSCHAEGNTIGMVVSSSDGGDTVDVKEESCNAEDCDPSDNDEVCKVEHTKPGLPGDFIEAPAYLVETELDNSDVPMQAEGTGSFQCGKCNLKFDSYGKLRYHSYSHRQRTKRLFCIGCGQGFEQSNDRDRHELECDVNLTNGHFNCIFCELPFDTPQTLRNHEKKHRPPKRYKRYKHMCLCAECDRAFDAVFTLKIHIRHMHRGSREKVKVKEEVEDVNFESDLTFEEYKFDGDLKVERFH